MGVLAGEGFGFGVGEVEALHYSKPAEGFVGADETGMKVGEIAAKEGEDGPAAAGLGVASEGVGDLVLFEVEVAETLVRGGEGSVDAGRTK